MKSDVIYKKYLNEKKLIRRFTWIRKIVSYSFLALFLYLLFSVSYTASVSIVILNYLALVTTFSGLIFYKIFEIPSCILEIKDKKNEADFFGLTFAHQKEILETTSKSLNLPLVISNENGYDQTQIVETYQLNERYDWRLIGKIYFLFYISLIGFSLYHVWKDFVETGFLRP